MSTSAKGRSTPPLWGFIDQDGEVVIPPRFEHAYPHQEGLAAVRLGGKSGFIDAAGAVVIEPAFDWAGEFSGGLGRVGVGDKYGFIDRSGSFVIPPEFDDADVFREGLSRVMIGELYGYIDRGGTMVIPPRFEFAEYFSCGYAAVHDPEDYDRMGFIDRSGKMRLGPFAGVRSFSEGWASVGNKDESWYIDTQGREVLRLPHQPLPVFGNSFVGGLAVAQLCDRARFRTKEGFIDREGKWVIRPRFDAAFGFYDGATAVVMVGKKHGAIDREGNFVVPPEYSILEEAAEGRRVFSRDGKHKGYLDAEGRVVIEPVYDAAHSFSEGLAAVRIAT